MSARNGHIPKEIAVPKIVDLSKPTCRTCKFYEPDEGQDKTGSCHFNPPTAQFVAAAGQPLGAGIRVAFFPAPSPDMWCGKHEARISMVGG